MDSNTAINKIKKSRKKRMRILILIWNSDFKDNIIYTLSHLSGNDVLVHLQVEIINPNFRAQKEAVSKVETASFYMGRYLN